MKKNLLLLFVLLFSVKSIMGQTEPINSTTNLYYLCKIWGYLKYFHTEVAKGTIDWDNVLIQNINTVKNAATAEEVNTAFLNVINAAGTMQTSEIALPQVPANLRYNLNLNWFQDSYLDAQVRSKLENVNTLFRPQSNFYCYNNSYTNDNSHYNETFHNSESIKILSLFRYWNIINYFYPYKDIIDKNWDDVLIEFLPKIIDTTDDISYTYTLLELFTRISDSHAFTTSPTISYLNGDYYLPINFTFIDGKTVISSIGKGITNCKPGDIIKKIDGRDVNEMRDSIKIYAKGSNEEFIQHYISEILTFRRTDNYFELLIEDNTGTKKINLKAYTLTEYYELFPEEDPIWEILNKNGKSFGYIDMERLTLTQISTMFNELWNCDALIFDLRNVPNWIVGDMISYLFPQQVKAAHFTRPSSTYPGTFTSATDVWLGSGNFSTCYNNPIYLLMNEKTLSKGEYTIMAFEQHPKAVKIGSRTAGADGNVNSIYLPFRVYTHFTGQGVFYPDGRQTQRIGLAPDIEVKPTIQGIRDGRDEVLEAAFNHYVTTGVENSNELPEQYSLAQNYPNPFNPATTINYTIVETPYMASLHRVTLKVYDTLGREITTLVDEIKQPGTYSVKFNGAGLPSGVYFYQINAGSYRGTKKLLLLK